jgi:hypothetical protein
MMMMILHQMQLMSCNAPAILCTWVVPVCRYMETDRPMLNLSAGTARHHLFVQTYGATCGRAAPVIASNSGTCDTSRRHAISSSRT